MNEKLQKLFERMDLLQEAKDNSRTGILTEISKILKDKRIDPQAKKILQKISRDIKDEVIDWLKFSEATVEEAESFMEAIEDEISDSIFDLDEIIIPPILNKMKKKLDEDGLEELEDILDDVIEKESQKIINKNSRIALKNIKEFRSVFKKELKK